MEAQIVKDSINTVNHSRLTSFLVTFPRMINAEVLRHRMLSFNSASSRAIPLKRTLEMVREDPAMPVFWGKNKAGMSADEELDDNEQIKIVSAELQRVDDCLSAAWDSYEMSKLQVAKQLWVSAGRSMSAVAGVLNELGLHKQIANRILEPWMNITLLITGTEWENFFKLRANPSAQPEFQELANRMLTAYNFSTPVPMEPITLEQVGNLNLWEHHSHIPFDQHRSGVTNIEQLLKVSIARNARLSYLTHDGDIRLEDDLALFERLESNGHWSPFEHTAVAVDCAQFFGNLKGWFPYRKLYLNENAQDPRVIKKKVIINPERACTHTTTSGKYIPKYIVVNDMEHPEEIV